MKNYYKVLFIIFICSVLFLNTVISQDLKDNEYYKKAVQIFSDAKTEYEKGDYDKGYELSEEAKKLLDIANQDNLLKMYALRIEALKKAALEKINYAKSEGAEKNEAFLKTLNKAIELFDGGDKKYAEGKTKQEFKEKSVLYAEAIDLFTESERWARQVLLDMWPNGKDGKTVVAADSDKDEAAKFLAAAQKRLKETRENVEEVKYIDKLKEADGLFSEAKKFYDENSYKLSLEKSKSLLALLDTFEYAMAFPKYYTVILNKAKRDCLWRITAKDFVYNDKYKWKIIYEANKDKLKNPKNPNLIHPDIVLELPSINGEVRQGIYDPKKTYPKFDPKKDYTKK